MNKNGLIWCLTVAVLLTVGGCRRDPPRQSTDRVERVTIDSEDCLRRAIAWGKPAGKGSPDRVPFTYAQREVMERVARDNDRELGRRTLARSAEIEADAELLERRPPTRAWASVFGTGRLACARSAWCQELWKIAGPELVRLEEGR